MKQRCPHNSMGHFRHGIATHSQIATVEVEAVENAIARFGPFLLEKFEARNLPSAASIDCRSNLGAATQWRDSAGGRTEVGGTTGTPCLICRRPKTIGETPKTTVVVEVRI